MVPSPEHRWPRLLAGYVAFVGLLVRALTPIYFYAEASFRPTVVRLGAAGVIGIALIHLLRTVRMQISGQPPSGFQRALARAPAEPTLALLFLTLQDEVRYSTRNQGYFERVLWPRLLTLLGRRAATPPAAWPVKPAGRRPFRKGPSLATLRQLITEIEERLL